MPSKTGRLPNAPKLPSDLLELETMGPYEWVAIVECAAKRERVAYIGQLISDALSISVAAR